MESTSSRTPQGVKSQAPAVVARACSRLDAHRREPCTPRRASRPRDTVGQLRHCDRAVPTIPSRRMEEFLNAHSATPARGAAPGLAGRRGEAW